MVLNNKAFKLPAIPISYLVFALIVGLVVLRAIGIDSWTTATLSSIVGFTLGKNLEQAKNKNKN